MVGLQTTNIYFSPFWRLEVQDQDRQILVRALFWVATTLCLLTWHKGKQALQGLFYKGTNHLPKAPPFNTITVGVRWQNINFGGHNTETTSSLATQHLGCCHKVFSPPANVAGLNHFLVVCSFDHPYHIFIYYHRCHWNGEGVWMSSRKSQSCSLTRALWRLVSIPRLPPCSFLEL